MTEPEKIAKLKARVKKWREWAGLAFYDIRDPTRMTDEQLRCAVDEAYSAREQTFLVVPFGSN